MPAEMDPIPLSAVQHAVYCLRQAALIHLERLWAENRFTAEGDVLHAVAEGRGAAIGPLMRRLEGQGVLPVTLCIGAMRHFRILHAAACDPGGPAAGVPRMRPPVFGPRRDRIIRQAGEWGVKRLEEALGLLVETDLTLRSSSRAPAMAVMERALIRLAMMRR